jgi:hypothetical protein
MNATVSSERVMVDGLTPGSSIALLGVARETGAYVTHVVSRRELLTDDDHDGKIDYAPAGGIAFRSVWMVADLDSGETAIVSRSGYKPVEMKEIGAGRGNSVNLLGNILDIARPRVEILVVRPRRGAWFMVTRGRGTEPAIGNGRLRVDAAKLRPLKPGFDAAPAAFIPGDVILVLDEEELEYWAVTVTPGGR